MAKWLTAFEKALKRRMPDKVDIDPNAYDYRIDYMGVERIRTGFEQISVCVDELYGLGYDGFGGAVKRAAKYMMEMYNQTPYYLFAVMQDGSFGYIARASQDYGLKLKYTRSFEEARVIRKNGADLFKPKKASLCLLIADRADFGLPDDTIKKLKRAYGKVILLNFACDDIVTQIK